MARTELAPRSAGILHTALQLLTLLVLLAIFAALVLVLFSVSSLTSVSSQVGGVASQATRALGSAQQAVENAVDPNHPPSGLTYDTAFVAIDTWHVGDALPGGTDYVVTLTRIERRSGAQSADTGLYAVVRAQLRQPRETRILGQLVRSDNDAHDYVVYTGEAFRIGHVVYRANWISQETDTLAAGVLRNPDMMTQPFKFDYP
jgi:type II secretory pathway pseudopilin PulG